MFEQAWFACGLVAAVRALGDDGGAVAYADDPPVACPEDVSAAPGAVDVGESFAWAESEAVFAAFDVHAD